MTTLYLDSEQLSMFQTMSSRSRLVTTERHREEYPHLANLADIAISNYGQYFVNDMAKHLRKQYIKTNFIEPAMVVAVFQFNFNEATMISLLKVHEDNCRHFRAAIDLCIERFTGESFNLT